MFGLAPLAWRLIGYGVIALTVLGVVGRVTFLWKEGRAAVHHEQVVAKQTKAIVVVERKLTATHQASEKTAQARLEIQHRIIIKRIPVYVSTSPAPPVGCITWGLVRLHDAAVLGVSPDDLPNPADQPDNACSSVADSDFAAAVADNYAAARANAEQLDALEADVSARVAAAAPKE